MGSSHLLSIIGQTLLWIIKEIKVLLVGTVGTAFSVGATVIDQLAWLISRGASVSVEISGYVKTLIFAIFRFLGRGVNKVESLTIAFVRWVLMLFFSTLLTMASNALSRIF
jgi:triacylglycerol lipase